MTDSAAGAMAVSGSRNQDGSGLNHTTVAVSGIPNNRAAQDRYSAARDCCAAESAVRRAAVARGSGTGLLCDKGMAKAPVKRHFAK